MSSNRYPKQCYYMLMRQEEAGKLNWTAHVKDLLFTYGFGYAWIVQDVGNDKEFLKMFTDRIKLCFKQQWHSALSDSNKSKHFRHFKSTLNPELYLSIGLSNLLQKSLANFRCSSDDFLIEKGRYLSIDPEHRFFPICKTCNISIVEDEFHFFFEYPSYENLRKKYFKTYWLNNRTLLMFYRILNLTTKDTIYKVSKYLAEAFNLRKDMLNELL